MDVLMPQLGETVAEGTVAQWFKKAGDRVAVDEALLEVETDKVTTEVPALIAGTLSEILVGEGETVAAGTRLAVIESANDEAPEQKATAVLAPVPQPAPAPIKTRGRRARRDDRLSPVVRRLLDEHGLSPSDITGDGGRITRRDVLAHIDRLKEGTAKSAPADEREDETIPFNAYRKRTAEHMVRSKATSPHVLQAVEADFEAVEAVRAAHKDAWRAAHGFSLTYLPFVARATCLAMARYPRLNASLGDQALNVHKRIHLSIAVDLDFDGLIAPVIRDAEDKSLIELAQAIHDLATRARQGKLVPDDLSGGTYTISNAGTFGTLITAPIINQPQVAILSVDGIAKKPVVVETPSGDAIAIHRVGLLAQSFDHRAVDGAYSAAFLKTLKDIVETHDWTAELV